MDKNKKNRVLLIDDDELTRIYFRDIFWIHGRGDIYDVSLASSLEEASVLIEDEKTRPSVVFLDILISKNGDKNDIESQIRRSYDFISEIKKNKVYSDLKIIIYSSQKDKKIQKKFEDLGIDGFLIKGNLLPKELITYTDNVYGFNN